MNTNSNVYTVIYTTIVVVIVAAVLAFVSQKLGPMQAANQKAETISQILNAAQFEDFGATNAQKIEFYKANIAESYVIDAEGNRVADLNAADAEVYSTSQLKAQNYKVKGGEAVELPVYKFQNGISVIPIYGAGLWGPVWGYIAFESDLCTIAGAYFDHESETPGLGGKIKDDPAFRAQFSGKAVNFNDDVPFAIVKGGAPEGKVNAVDAITGATMTSKGVSAAIVTWLKAYQPALASAPAAPTDSCCCTCCGEGNCENCCGNCSCEDCGGCTECVESNEVEE